MFKIVLLTCVVASAFGSTLEPIELRKLRLNPLFPDGRVVGGEKIDIREAPHQVSLQYGGQHYCGGSLISENHVLTAAHCIQNLDIKRITVRAGTSESESGGTVIPVKKAYIFPEYCSVRIDYDVGILILGEKAPLSDTVKIIKVSDVEAPDNLTVTITGYGQTEPREARHLRGVKLPVILRSKCKEMYHGVHRVTDRMMCTYAPGKSSCKGDSGSAVFADGKVYGIVSWALGCARPGYPSVQANVAHEVLRTFINVIAKV